MSVCNVQGSMFQGVCAVKRTKSEAESQTISKCLFQVPVSKKLWSLGGGGLNIECAYHYYLLGQMEVKNNAQALLWSRLEILASALSK